MCCNIANCMFEKEKVFLSCGQQSLLEFDIVGSFEVGQGLDRAQNDKDFELDRFQPDQCYLFSE